jgi:hypothetical protein
MARVKTIKVGTAFAVYVSQEVIDESIPCDKGNCMLTMASTAMLSECFGPGVRNVKSTNHGLTFDFNGYRILCVFDHQTGHRIYKYDEIYKKTRNMSKARASVKPFRAKLMVESCQKIPTYPPMSEETKKLLATAARLRVGAGVKTGLRTSNRRQLSE